MTVSELFKKYDFESILPHLNHLFMVNSGRHFSEASIRCSGIFINIGPNVKQNLRIATFDLPLAGNIPVLPLI